MSATSSLETYTTKWKINDMEYGLHGVVHTVHWSCIAGILEDGSDYVTTNGVTQLQNTSHDVDGFIDFSDLSEQMVLEWVKEQMQEKWDETEESIVAAWEETKWNKEDKKGLPWVEVPRSDEEEEPSWIQAALTVTQTTEPESVFEPLDMPVDDEFATDVGQWRHEGENEEFRASRVALAENIDDSEEDEVTETNRKPYVNKEGRTGVTFGTNIDKEEE